MQKYLQNRTPAFSVRGEVAFYKQVFQNFLMKKCELEKSF